MKIIQLSRNGTTSLHINIISLLWLFMAKSKRYCYVWRVQRI